MIWGNVWANIWASGVWDGLYQLSNQDVTKSLHGMFVFEFNEVERSEYGNINYIQGDTTTDFGVIERRTDTLFDSELGLVVSILETDDNLLLIYESIAPDIEDTRHESELPEFMQKYNEIGTLARAYSMNTDAKIGSLADYWSYRYTIGLEMIKRYKNKRRQDRDYQLSTRHVNYRKNRHARLPDSYPEP